MEKFLFWLNKLLLLDVFLVFFFFIWFVAAVIANSNHLNLGLDLWQRLWMPVIQPALGVVMLGAILSGLSSKFTKKSKGE
jgi:cadmium resistance protein CadD (predicted permease)